MNCQDVTADLEILSANHKVTNKAEPELCEKDLQPYLYAVFLDRLVKDILTRQLM